MKRNLFTSSIFGVLMLLAGNANTQTVTLHLKPNATDGKDAYLSSSMPSTNFGTHEEFSGDAWTCGGNPCYGRGLIEFDLSSIPVGSSIVSATLNLKANPNPLNGGGIAMQGQNESVIRRVISTWTEGAVAWNTQPNTSTQNEVIIPESVSSFQDYPSIDVTMLVQDMVNDPANSYGFQIRLVNEVYYASMIFASSDYPDSAKWPEITIDYLMTDCSVIDVADGNGQDAYLASATPTVNYGNHLELSGDAWTCGGTPCYGRGLFQFDLSAIPSNAVVSSANLSLYAHPNPANGGGIAMQGSNEAEILRVTSSWQENTVTWASAPGYTTLNKVTLPQSTTSFQDYLNIDIKDLIQDMVSNPAMNYGMMLKLVNEAPYTSMIFASSEYSNLSKHPTIEVCWYIPTSLNFVQSKSFSFSVFPNPFNSEIMANVNLKNSSDLHLSVKDIAGKLIKSEIYKKISMGAHDISLTELFENCEAGVYFITIDSADGYRVTKKVVKS